MKQEIAQRLAARRKHAGLSQEGLAEQLGVSRQAVSKWECGECAPDTENLIALAVLYEVSLDDLLWKDLEAGEGKDEPVDASGEGYPHAARSGDEAPSTHAAGHAFGHGESVHVSWRDGVHVVDPVKGEEVHVGWDGIRVKSAGVGDDGVGGANADARAASGAGSAADPDAAQGQGDWFAARDGSGHTFETDGSTVVVDGVRYDSWHEAHRAHGHRRDEERLWKRFPFPLLVIVSFVFVGVFTGLWVQAAFLFFLIPLYYLVGNLAENLAETRGVARFVEAAYPIGSVVFFCYMALIEGAPHPAWLVFLTIPLVECACVECSRWWKGRAGRRSKGDGECGE